MSASNIDPRTFNPFADYHEDFGPCLFVDEDFNETHDIYFGQPYDSDWPFSHRQEKCLWWTKLPILSLTTKNQ